MTRPEEQSSRKKGKSKQPGWGRDFPTQSTPTYPRGFAVYFSVAKYAGNPNDSCEPATQKGTMGAEVWNSPATSH